MTFDFLSYQISWMRTLPSVLLVPVKWERKIHDFCAFGELSSTLLTKMISRLHESARDKVNSLNSFQSIVKLTDSLRTDIMFRKSSNVKAPSPFSENTSQILLLKGFSCQETERERYCRCSSCLLALDFPLCMLVPQEKVLFLAHNKSFSDQVEVKMAGYWTRLQFLLI